MEAVSEVGLLATVSDVLLEDRVWRVGPLVAELDLLAEFGELLVEGWIWGNCFGS